MGDERDLLPDNMPVEDGPDEADYEYPLLSAEDFDGELEALEAYAVVEDDEQAAAGAELAAEAGMPDDGDEMDEFVQLVAEEPDSEAVPEQDLASGVEAEQHAIVAARQDAGAGSDSAAWDDEDRLRQPRAQTFRRRLRNQVGMLPLALFLLALGGYLIARKQDTGGLPDFSTLALAEFSVLAVGFTTIFHALLSGRRERGLLFVGLWIWVTAVMLGVVVYGIDEHPDAAEWWPLLLWSLALTLLVTYVIERTHDARLLLLSVLVLVAGATAYWVTSDRIADQWLTTASDYWPLLLSVVGIGLLPLAFRRRAS